MWSRLGSAWSGRGVGLALAILYAGSVRAHDIPNQRVDRSIQVTLISGAAGDRLRGQPDRADADAGPPLAGRPPAGCRAFGVAGPLRRGDGPAECEGFPGLRGRGTGRHGVGRLSPDGRGPSSLHVPPRGRGSPPRAGWRSATPTSPRAKGRAGWRSAGGTAWSSRAMTGRRTSSRCHPPGVGPERRRGAQDQAGRRPLSRTTRNRAAHAPAVEPSPDPRLSEAPRPSVPSAEPEGRPWALSRLLDRGARLPWTVLALIALGLGAAHAIQPGHGKTLVTAAALGPGGAVLSAGLARPGDDDGPCRQRAADRGGAVVHGQ